MLILALDTSSPSGSLAVLEDTRVIGVVSTSVDEIYSSRMFRHLEFLLGELKITLGQIDLFAVAIGPGSFTGLRVGLTAVKGWAEVYNKPIAAVSALEAVAVQAKSVAPFLAAVLDARRGQFYYGIFHYTSDASHTASRIILEGKEGVATPAELIAALGSYEDRQVTIVTPVLELVSTALSRLNLKLSGGPIAQVDAVSAVLAPAIGQLGYEKHQRGELMDALTLNANYVRRSDAELHLKE